MVISIAVVIVVPDLLKQGMFMDGQQYACVAKNLANNKGTFWKPFLSETWLIQGKNEFLEHPPLFYFFESLAFRIVGEFYLTEKLFSLFTFIMHLFLIRLIWKETVGAEMKKNSWLSIFCWSLIPIVSWVFQNNMIEELLSVFTMLSVFLTVKASHSKKGGYVFLFFSGLMVFCATLTKGLPGFFPVIVPLFIYLCFKKNNLFKAVSGSFILFLIPALIYFFLFFFNQEAKESLTFYIKNRLFHRISEQPSTDFRLFTIMGLMQELIPLIILLAIIFTILKLKKKQIHFDHQINKTILFFLLIGISASFPLMMTMVQNKFYFFPALPYFAIAFALLINLFGKQLVSKRLFLKKSKTLFIIGALMLVSSVAYSINQINKFSRDEKMIKDVVSIINYTGRNKNIGVEKEIYYQWNFQFYLLRYGDISIEDSGKKHNYFISFKNNSKQDSNYVASTVEMNDYTLYRLKELR